jgi:hypothetical protein
MLDITYSPPDGVLESVTEPLLDDLMKAIKKQARGQHIYPREVIPTCMHVIAYMVVGSDICRRVASAISITAPRTETKSNASGCSATSVNRVLVGSKLK